MGFRVVLIENEASIKVKLDNLIIRREEKDIWIPLEDVSILVIDNLQIMISTRTMCLLAQHNIGVIFCDQEHLPIGYYSSYDNHSRISKYIGYQIKKSEEFNQELWRKIVKAKIQNQRMVLQRIEKDDQVIDALGKFESEVKKGDITNREAHAAKVYFNELMGTTFSRGNEDLLINSGLDYGYAIMRSYLARLCVAYGLNSQLGIHHCNEYNRFNLVDDMIEPFRPFVDFYVYNLLQDEQYFKIEHRRKLINLLNHKMYYKTRKMYFCNVMEEYVSSIAALIADKNNNVVFPAFVDYLGEKDEL